VPSGTGRLIFSSPQPTPSCGRLYLPYRRESEIHHMDLDVGYTHQHWPADFVGLKLPRVLPTLDARLPDEVAVQVEVIDCHWPQDRTTTTPSQGHQARCPCPDCDAKSSHSRLSGPAQSAAWFCA
jgi:hypothetical protein